MMAGFNSSLIARIPALAALFIPPAVALIYIASIAVDVPYNDEWALVSDAAAWKSGSGSWTTIFSQYDTYMIALQKAAAYISVKYLDWDVRLEIYAGFALLLATGAIFAGWLARAGVLSTATGALCAFPIFAALFSLRQWENLLAPWSPAFSGSIFFAAATASLLAMRPAWPLMLLAAACAAGGAITFLNGFLLWPLGFATLIVTRRFREAGAWVALACAFFFVMLSGYRVGDAAAFLQIRPSALPRFFVLLGGPFSLNFPVLVGATQITDAYDSTGGVIIGAGVLGLAAFALIKTIPNIRDYIFPVFILFFSGASAAMIAIGRSYQDVFMVFASRYNTVMMFGLAGLLLLILMLRQKGIDLITGRVALATGLLVSWIFSTAAESYMAPYRRAYLSGWAENVRTYKNGGDLTNPHMPPEKMRGYVETLDQSGLSLFRKRPAD